MGAAWPGEADLRIEDQRHRHPGFARVKTQKVLYVGSRRGKETLSPTTRNDGGFPSSFFFAFSFFLRFFSFSLATGNKVASHSLIRLNSVATGRIVNGRLQGPAAGPSVSILGAR